MREPYLLAGSLLTGLILPAWTLPQVSIILPESSQFLSDFKHNSQLTVGETNIPSVDIYLARIQYPYVAILTWFAINSRSENHRQPRHIVTTIQQPGINITNRTISQ